MERRALYLLCWHSMPPSSSSPATPKFRNTCFFFSLCLTASLRRAELVRIHWRKTRLVLLVASQLARSHLIKNDCLTPMASENRSETTTAMKAAYDVPMPALKTVVETAQNAKGAGMCEDIREADNDAIHRSLFQPAASAIPAPMALPTKRRG